MTDPKPSEASPKPSEASLNEILATIEVGDVVAIGLHQDPFWTGCLLRVEETRSWGVSGSIRGPQGTEYPLRVARKNITTVFRERR